MHSARLRLGVRRSIRVEIRGGNNALVPFFVVLQTLDPPMCLTHRDVLTLGSCAVFCCFAAVLANVCFCFLATRFVARDIRLKIVCAIFWRPDSWPRDTNSWPECVVCMARMCSVSAPKTLAQMDLSFAASSAQI